MLTLSILRCPEGVPSETRHVSGGEFTIGRDTRNDWVLPDPDRYLSKRHCVLDFGPTGWQIADTSTNGTYLNHEIEPLRGTPRALRDGDRILMGAYEMEVSLHSDEERLGERLGERPGERLEAAAAGRGRPSPSSHMEDRLVGDPFPSSVHDPLGLSGGGIGLPSRFDPLDPSDEADAAPVMRDGGLMDAAFRPPRPADLLPDDWNLEDEPPAAPARAPDAHAPDAPAPEPHHAEHPMPVTPFPEPPVPVPPLASRAIPAEVVPASMPADPTWPGSAKASAPAALAQADPEPERAFLPLPLPEPSAYPVAPEPMPDPAALHPVEPPPEPLPKPRPGPPYASEAGGTAPPDATAEDGSFAAFLHGAAVPLPSGGVSRDRSAATLHALGSAFRAVVHGLRQIMIARASIKGEFRIEQTTIRATGNNPLKFSADDDDALAALLNLGRRSDVSPEAAISDALEDMRLHEVAMMAAMQDAVRELLARLEPAKLLDGAGNKPGDVIPGWRRARAWLGFETLHRQVVDALSDDFDSVFGKAFARAYERAMADAQRGQGRDD